MNQINYNQIDEEQRQLIEREFETKRQILLFPMVIVDGVDSISQGIYTKNPNRFKSASFENVFQGRNPVIVVWKNSTTSINQRTQGGEPDFSKPAFKDYKVGDYIPVILDADGETYFQSFSDDKNGNKRFSTTSTINIRLKGEFTREQWYEWQYFPELGEEFYYPEAITVYRDEEGVFAYTELTLKKVNDELEMITTNADTLILRSSPGEEYAWPKLSKTLITINGAEQPDEKKLWQNVELDQDILSKVSGVKYLQLTSSEPMLLGSFYAFGRKIKTDDEGRKLILESSHLLPSEMVQALPDPILGTNIPSDKFYWMEQGRVSVGREYKNWWKTFTNALSGVFGMGGNKDSIKNYGAIRFPDISTATKSAPEKSKVDDMGNVIKVPQVYWDRWKIKARADITYSGRKGYKTMTPYSVERMQNTEAFLHDKLAKNVFILGSIVQIPIEYKSKIPKGLLSMTIGGIYKLIIGVKNLMFNNKTDRLSDIDLPLLGESSYIDFISEGLMASGDAGNIAKEYMPLQLFTEKRPEILTGKNINNLSVKIELTDTVEIKGTEIHTSQLGKNNTNYYDADTKTVRTEGGYILDRIIIQGICMGNIKISAFDEANNPLAAFTFESNSKRTGSILEWSTMLKTSKWESDETKDITPKIPGPGFLGKKEARIPDYIFRKLNTTKPMVETETLEIMPLDLYDEFKKTNEKIVLTREEFLEKYSIEFDISNIIEHNGIANVVSNTGYNIRWKGEITTRGHPLSKENISFISPNIRETWFHSHQKLAPWGDAYIFVEGQCKIFINKDTGILTGSITGKCYNSTENTRQWSGEDWYKWKNGQYARMGEGVLWSQPRNSYYNEGGLRHEERRGVKSNVIALPGYYKSRVLTLKIENIILKAKV